MHTAASCFGATGMGAATTTTMITMVVRLCSTVHNCNKKATVTAAALAKNREGAAQDSGEF